MRRKALGVQQGSLDVANVGPAMPDMGLSGL